MGLKQLFPMVPKVVHKDAQRKWNKYIHFQTHIEFADIWCNYIRHVQLNIKLTLRALKSLKSE
jgi:hypothetical protein